MIAIGKAQTDTFHHVGIEIHRRDEGTVTLSQQQYIRATAGSPKGIRGNAKPTRDDAIRSLIGALMWIACISRPDIASEVSMLAAETPMDWQTAKKANKCLRYLQVSNDVALSYSQLSKKRCIVVYADAAFQNLPSHRSLGGCMVGLMDHPDSFNQHTSSTVPIQLIAWKSNAIRRVTKSTFAAELLNQTTMLDYAIWIQQLYEAMSGVRLDVILLTDCQNVRDHVHSLRNMPTEKRMASEVALLREALDMGELQPSTHSY